MSSRKKSISKKFMNAALASSLIFTTVSIPVLSATTSYAQEMTAMEKFQILKSKGIFSGRTNDEPALESDMTRAEMATILVRLFGLTPINNKVSYVDTQNHWAQTEGYIEAVTQAGYMDGKNLGKFDPDGKITLEEMSAVLVRALRITANGSMAVSGKVSDWARVEVEAALESGLITSLPDYTIASLRNQLVLSTYETYNKINQNLLAVTHAQVTGSKTVEISFSQPVPNSANATFAVDRAGIAVNGDVTWNNEKTVATFRAYADLMSGDYKVVVNGLGLPSERQRTTFTVGSQNMKTIQIESNGYRLDTVAPNNSIVKLGFKILNAYGEDITLMNSNTNFVVSSSLGSATITGTGEVTITGVPVESTSLIVTMIDKISTSTQSTSVNIAQQKQIAELTIAAPTPHYGESQLTFGKFDYVIPYTAKDQFGNEVRLVAGDLSKMLFISSDPTVIDPNTGFELKDVNGDGKLDLTVDTLVFDGPREVSLTALMQSTGKTSKITFSVNGKAKGQSPEIIIPSSRFGASDTNFPVELRLKNQYGTYLTADEIVSANNNGELIIQSGNPSVFTVAAAKVIRSGDKAYVQLNGVSAGAGLLIITVTSTGQTSSQTISVVDPKMASSVGLTPDYNFAVKGAKIKLKATFNDQYGDKIVSSDQAVKLTVSDPSAFASSTLTTTVSDLANNGVELTALDWSKSAIVTATLYKEAAGTTIVTTGTANLGVVRADAALNYDIAELGKLSIIGSANKNSGYAKKLTLFAQDSSGNKVAVKSSDILGASSSNTSAMDTGTNSAGDYVVVAKGTENAAATVTVTVNANSGIKTITKNVTISNEVPVAQSIVAKSGENTVISVKVSSGTNINLFTSPLLRFIVTDQFGTEAMSNISQTSIYVKDPSGNTMSDTDGLVTFTGAAGSKYVITAITNDGKTSIVEVIL